MPVKKQSFPKSIIGLLLVVSALLILYGCGSNSPSGPSPVPTPPAGVNTLTFASTANGLPVSGARVVVAGIAYTTNSSGVVTLNSSAAVGTTIDASAPGFIDRATVVRTDTPLTLWQVGPGYDATFVRQLVYNHGTTSEVLWRPAATKIYLQLQGAELTSSNEALAAATQAASLATAATRGRIEFQVNNSPPTNSTFITLLLNSSTPNAATTFVTLSNNRIVGGRIEFQSLSRVSDPSLVTHELGHILGFGHAPSGIMCPSVCSPDFTDPESSVWDAMWQRLPGTTYPDNDRSASAASAGSQEITFHCSLK